LAAGFVVASEVESVLCRQTRRQGSRRMLNKLHVLVLTKNQS